MQLEGQIGLQICNMSYQVFEGGFENEIDFWPKIHIGTLKKRIGHCFRKKCVC